MSPAALSLNFLVVGGSVAGLATAIALRQAGHRVQLLEASSSGRGGSGACRSPPNMTRILDRWGLGAELRQRCRTTTAIQFRDGDTSNILGVQTLSAPVIKQFGSDFLAYKHSDLYDVLHRHARAVGTSIRTGARVARVDPHAPCVFLASGERIDADVIIGADGSQSTVRECVMGSVQPSGQDDRHVYNFTVPLDKVRQDPDLQHLADTADWQIFMGNNCCLQGFALPQTNEYLVLLKTPAPADEECTYAPWGAPKPISSMQLDLSGLGPQAWKLAALAREATRTVNVLYDPFEQWVHEDGKVLLVGDAAHPQVPSGSQASAMAIEDACTLGALFAPGGLPSRARIPTLLSAYEDVRQPRCASVVQNERLRTDFVSLPHADPARAARDAGLVEARRKAVLELEDAEEEVVASNLGDYVMLWAHDADEAVEDWRTKWGGLMETTTAGCGAGSTTVSAAAAAAADARRASVTVHLEVSHESRTTGVEVC